MKKINDVFLIFAQNIQRVPSIFVLDESLGMQAFFGVVYVNSFTISFADMCENFHGRNDIVCFVTARSPCHTFITSPLIK